MESMRERDVGGAGDREALPSQVAPSPSPALHTRPEAGSTTAPASDRPSRTAATETAYQGSP